METAQIINPSIETEIGNAVNLLPVLYVAWSDYILTEEEIEIIKEEVNSQEWLSESEKLWVDKWLNPQNPPTPVDLKNWLVIIKRAVSGMTVKDKICLADLGVKIAETNTNEGISEKKRAKIHLTLGKIEKALGIVGEDGGNQFFKIEDKEERKESSFDLQKMTRILEGNQSETIRAVKKVIASPKFTLQHFESKAKYREQVYEWAKVLAEKGMGNMGYPKKFGGGGDLEAYFAVMETLSYHDLSLVIKFGVQFGLWGMSVYLLGTEKHHKKYLEAIGDLRLPGCFAMTETGHGSNVQGLETTATYDKETKEFVIHSPSKDATKEYIGNAAVHGQMATVFAKLIIDKIDFGVSAFIVPIRTPEGKSLENVLIEDCGPKVGLNGVDNGRLSFDHVRIPKDNMLDRFSSVNDKGLFQSLIPSDGKRFFTMLGTLVGGRVGISRSGLAAAKKGLTIAIRHGDRRRQFGPVGKSEIRILDYQTHQRKLMPLLANAYAMTFATKFLTDKFLVRTEKDAREVEALAAGMKAFSTWNATNTLQICREACGGKGYLSENMLADLKADTEIYTTFEGDNTVLMQLVAKSLIIDFQKEFHDINLLGMIRFVAEKAELALFEKNLIVVRKTSKDHLLDEDFHLSAFRARERDLLISTAQKLQSLMKSTDSFTAFNQCQQQLVDLAFANIEKIVLEQFYYAIEEMENSTEKEMLTKVSHLFAIGQIEKNKGWFLENGYMEGAKTEAISELHLELCAEVRHEAVPLVNAFGVPEACLPELVK